MNLPLLTVSEFTALAPEVDVSKYTSDTISGMINIASDIVGDIINYDPLAEDVVNEVQRGYITTRGDLVLFPSKIPVLSVTALSITRGAVVVSLQLVNSANSNKFNIDYYKRKVIYPYEEITLQGTPVFTNFFSLRNADFFTKISYRGGFEVSDLPQSIKQAAALIMRDILSNQYNIAGANRLQQGGISIDYTSSGKVEASKFVKDARRLLAPYVR